MNGEFLDLGSEKIYAEVQKINRELMSMADNVSKVNSKGLTLTPSGSNDAIKKLNADLAAQDKLIQQLQKKLEEYVATTRKPAGNPAKPLQDAFQQLNQTYKEQLANARNLGVQYGKNSKEFKEAAKAAGETRAQIDALNKTIRQGEKLDSYYTAIQNKINSLSAEYNNLAAKQQIGIRLTGEEARRLEFLTGKIIGYENALKKVDFARGKFQRDVGNYSAGAANINRSITTIATEIPNFFQSIEIGVRSLTNNIQPVREGLSQLRSENEALAAQGKPTQSGLKAITSALLSWQTALFVGIGLLSAYSGEISNFVKGLFTANNELEELNKRQKEFNDAKISGVKDAQAEIIEVRKYLAVVKDRNLSDEERAIALKKLRQEYPFYFKSLTDEQILLGQSTKAESELTTALQKKFEAQKKTELNVTNKQRLIDLENEKRLQKEIIEQADQRAKSLSENPSARPEAYQGISEKAEKARKRLVEIENEYSATQKQIIKNDTDIFNLKKQIIGLEYSPESAQNAEQYFKYIESLNQEAYELAKFRLEREIEELSKVAENEKASYEGRIEAYGEMIQKKQELLMLSLNFELKESAQAREKLLYEANKEYQNNREKFKSDKESLAKIENDYREEVSIINSRFNSKDLLLKERFNKEYLDIVEETSRAEIEIRKRQDDTLRAAQELTMQRESKMFNDIANNEKLSVDVRQQAFRAQLALEKKRLDLAEIREKAENPDKIEEITEKYKNLRGELEKLESPYEETAKSARDMFKSMSDSLNSDLFNGLESFKGFFDGTFKKTMEVFDYIPDEAERVAKKAAYAFVQISEAAQEAFAFVDQIQQQQFEAQLSRLEREKDVALAFAGESAGAREEIERQYDARRRQIQRQQAEAEKRQAIFNVIINTAQAIAAAVAQSPLTGGLPFSAIAAAIGAAQIAVIAAQPIPQFKDGGKHKGGLMMVNDGAGSNYREIIKTPDGKISMPEGRNVIMDAPAGTEIFNASKSRQMLDNILMANGISYAKPNGGVTREDIKNGMIDAIATMPQGDSITWSIDSRGEAIYRNSQNRYTRLMNNKKTFTAKRIGR